MKCGQFWEILPLASTDTSIYVTGSDMAKVANTISKELNVLIN